MPTHDANQIQREYYAGPIRPALVPVESHYVRRHLRELLDIIHPTPEERILEVGCGMGRFTLPLHRDGFLVEGLDLSPVLLERFREYAFPNCVIPLHCADMLHPPESLFGKFDLVIGFFCLHHIPNLMECFQSMRKLIRPGGRVAFAEPNGWNPLFYIQIFLSGNMSWKADGGVTNMRTNKITPAMREAGFTDITFSRYGFFPPFLLTRPLGVRFEAFLEGHFPWKSLLPFQIISGRQL